MKLALRSL